MSDKIIIGVDVDGVLRDFANDLMHVVMRDYPQYLIPGQDVIDDWRLEKCFNCSKEKLQSIYWDTNVDEIMGNGNKIPGSELQITELLDFANQHEDLVEFWAVTSQKKHAFHYTLKWLGQQGYNFKRVVFERGREKWKVGVDWLIDDSPSNWEAWKEGRGDDKNYILMDAVYNQHIEPTIRIKELLEIYDIVRK